MKKNNEKTNRKEKKEAENIVKDLLNPFIGTIPKQAEYYYMKNNRAEKAANNNKSIFLKLFF